MFKNIYFDAATNKMHLWECFDGKTSRDAYDISYEYYVDDLTGQSTIKDIYGNPVQKKISKEKFDIRQLKDSGVKCYETDIADETKFLQNRYSGLDMKFNISDFNIAYLDIEIESQDTFPEPDLADYEINLISVEFSKTKEIWTFGNRPYDGLHNYVYCDSEERLLERFIQIFRKNKVDIITGWYVKAFDIKYIIKRCQRYGLETKLSPINKIKHNKKYNDYTIPGISILDYRELYMNKTFIPDTKESYSLNFIAMTELKEGKLEFEGAIYDLYKTDWQKYVDYNRQDVALVRKLEKKLKLIELTISICYRALIPFEKIFSSIQVITGLILTKLKMKNLVMPDKVMRSGDDDEEEDEYDGGYVEAKPGMYQNVISFDVTSMYPHMIMMYNISPETLRIGDFEEVPSDLIRTPVPGTYYLRNKKGILPEIVEEIFKQRMEFKKLKDAAAKAGDKEKMDYYHNQQMTMKILINSIYGVLGNKYFHFYNVKNAEAVTLSGQHLIKYLSNSVNTYFKEYFHKNKKYFPVQSEDNKIKKDVLIYLDTDSNYLCLKEIKEKIAPNENFLDWANKFNEEFFVGFFDKILQMYADQFQVEQLIDFKREKIISKQLILSKKRYVCEVIDDEGKVLNPPKFDVKGIESKRSSHPKFCREKIDEVVKHIFNTEDRDTTIDMLKQIRKDFKSKPIEVIAFPRGVTDYDKYAKDAAYYVKSGGLDYPKHVPIHVRASMNYNYLSELMKLRTVPIANGSKIKFVYTTTRNKLNQNVIGFVGNCPQSLKDMFQVDYDLQFEKSFLDAIQTMFTELGWGEINLNANNLKKFFG